VSSDEPEVEGMRRCAASHHIYAGKTTAAVEEALAIAEVVKPDRRCSYLAN
jgi:hypothetical protein